MNLRKYKPLWVILCVAIQLLLKIYKQYSLHVPKREDPFKPSEFVLYAGADVRERQQNHVRPTVF